MIDFSCKTNAADAAHFFRVLQTTIVSDSLKNKTQNNNHKVILYDHNSWLWCEWMHEGSLVLERRHLVRLLIHGYRMHFGSIFVDINLFFGRNREKRFGYWWNVRLFLSPWPRNQEEDERQQHEQIIHCLFFDQDKKNNTEKFYYIVGGGGGGRLGGGGGGGR